MTFCAAEELKLLGWKKGDIFKKVTNWIEFVMVKKIVMVKKL